MHQLLFFKIKNKRSGKSVKMECRIEYTDTPFFPVTFIVDIDKLTILLARGNNSPFCKKLLQKGETVVKMRATFWNIKREDVLKKIKKEFGNRFLITFVPVRGSELRPVVGNMGTGKSRKTVKRAAPKKAKKRAAKKKVSGERWSNFSGPTDGKEKTIALEADFDGFGGIENVELSEAMDGSDSDVGYDTVEVLFATDRNKTNSKDPNKAYGTARNALNNLEYGICKISIPPEHETGNIERPSWYERFFFSDPENPKDHIVIYALKTKSEIDFLSCLRSKITSSTNKDAFIFVHGFNVSFQAAIRRTAQIAHDLSFKGAAISYSWPSLAKARSYMSDEDSIMWTVPHLKILIKNVLSDLSLAKLHLIAHSMGNRALTNAIKELKAEGFNLEKINQIVLAAPDIDSKVFTDVIVPGIKGVSKQITLYASSKDLALTFSHFIRSGIIRAGESGENMVIIDGISTVDASMVGTGLLSLGHGYFAETKELINDLYLMLEHSFEPQQRNLRKQEKPPKGVYWLFPA